MQNLNYCICAILLTLVLCATAEKKIGAAQENFVATFANGELLVHFPHSGDSITREENLRLETVVFPSVTVDTEPLVWNKTLATTELRFFAERVPHVLFNEAGLCGIMLHVYDDYHHQRPPRAGSKVKLHEFSILEYIMGQSRTMTEVFSLFFDEAIDFQTTLRRAFLAPKESRIELTKISDLVLSEGGEVNFQWVICNMNTVDCCNVRIEDGEIIWEYLDAGQPFARGHTPQSWIDLQQKMQSAATTTFSSKQMGTRNFFPRQTMLLRAESAEAARQWLPSTGTTIVVGAGRYRVDWGEWHAATLPAAVSINTTSASQHPTRSLFDDYLQSETLTIRLRQFLGGQNRQGFPDTPASPIVDAAKLKSNISLAQWIWNAVVWIRETLKTVLHSCF